MRARLTPAELAEMLAGLTRDETGMVCLEIPDACIQRDAPRLIVANPHIVRFEHRHATLQPIPHAIVRYVLANGPSPLGDVKDSVYLGKEVSDNAVEKACSRATDSFLDAGIPFTVSTSGGHITIEQLRD